MLIGIFKRINSKYTNHNDVFLQNVSTRLGISYAFTERHSRGRDQDVGVRYGMHHCNLPLGKTPGYL